MKKCRAVGPLLLAAFIVNFCLVPSLFSQNSDLLKQNSFNDISITTSDGQTAIVIKGNIKSINPSDIQIFKEQGSPTFTISVLNSLWDAVDMAGITKEFEADDPINMITIDNRFSTEPGKEGVFTVTFDVEAKQDFTPEIATPISESELRILLKGGASRVVSTKTIAQEREEAARMQKEIERRKQQAQMTAEETVESVLQQYRKPSVMQISIFNASGYPKRAYNLSVYLGKLKKEFVEESLGMKMEIVNISNAPYMNHLSSTIYFRNNYLKPALFLAKLIKGNQRIIPMPDQEKKQGVDIEIFLGRDYK